jgi:dolichol-phosphate mannosyltransferase
MTGRTVSIIVPAFNETHSLQGAVRDVTMAADAAGLDDFEIIVVDDGSTDGTAECADYLAAQCDWVRVVHHDGNRGLRAAYESGLERACTAYVTWVPGDGEMARESIQAILEAVGTADLVIPYHGTPERRTWLRRLLTWGSTSQLNFFLGHDLRYFQGTVVYPTDLARRLPRTEAGFFCTAEMLCHALDRGCSYVETPLIHQERQHGVSKAVGVRQVWRAQKLILRLWWRLRVRAAAEALGFALEAR